jgi:hypothetical protein
MRTHKHAERLGSFPHRAPPRESPRSARRVPLVARTRLRSR